MKLRLLLSIPIVKLYFNLTLTLLLLYRQLRLTNLNNKGNNNAESRTHAFKRKDQYAVN